MWRVGPSAVAIPIVWWGARKGRLRPTAQNSCCVGLFQLYYDLHEWWLADMGITTRSGLFDARANARAALALYQRAGWTPWALTPPPTTAPN